MPRSAQTAPKRSASAGASRAFFKRRQAVGKPTVEDRLRERVKELTLLHAAARLLQGNRRSDQTTLNELAALLPPAWQHATICHARIRYGTLEARTSGWRDSAWKISRTFVTQDGRDGTVEVVYLQERTDAAEGPFLAEERALLDSVAECWRRISIAAAPRRR